MKAYRCRPGVTFTVTVQGPFEPNRASGEAVLSQSLKSPTIETRWALAASNVIGTGTGRTARGSFAVATSGTLTAVDAGRLEVPSSPESAPRVPTPIASAAAASNPADATDRAGWLIHSSASIQRRGAGARRSRTAAMMRAAARESPAGSGLRDRAPRSITWSRSSIMLLHLGQSRPQHVACPLDPHAQRRQANTSQRRDVFV